MKLNSILSVLCLSIFLIFSNAVFAMNENQYRNHYFHTHSPLEKFIIPDCVSNEESIKLLKQFIAFFLMEEKLIVIKKNNILLENKLSLDIIENHFNAKIAYYTNFFSDTKKIINGHSSPFIYMLNMFPNCFALIIAQNRLTEFFNETEADFFIQHLHSRYKEKDLFISQYARQNGLDKPLKESSINHKSLAAKSNKILRNLINELIRDHFIENLENDQVNSVINYDLKQNTGDTNKLAKMIIDDELIFDLYNPNLIEDDNGNLSIINKTNNQEKTINLSDFLKQKNNQNINYCDRFVVDALSPFLEQEMQRINQANTCMIELLKTEEDERKKKADRSEKRKKKRARKKEAKIQKKAAEDDSRKRNLEEVQQKAFEKVQKERLIAEENAEELHNIKLLLEFEKEQHRITIEKLIKAQAQLKNEEEQRKDSDEKLAETQAQLKNEEKQRKNIEDELQKLKEFHRVEVEKKTSAAARLKRVNKFQPRHSSVKVWRPKIVSPQQSHMNKQEEWSKSDVGRKISEIMTKYFHVINFINRNTNDYRYSGQKELFAQMAMWAQRVRAYLENITNRKYASKEDEKNINSFAESFSKKLTYLYNLQRSVEAKTSLSPVDYYSLPLPIPAIGTWGIVPMPGASDSGHFDRFGTWYPNLR